MKEALKEQVINEINQSNYEGVRGIFASKDFQSLSDEEQLEIYTAAKDAWQNCSHIEAEKTEQEEFEGFSFISGRNKGLFFPVFLGENIEILQNNLYPISSNKEMENNTNTENLDKEDEDYISEKRSTSPKKQSTESSRSLSKEKYEEIEAYIETIVANNKQFKTTPDDYEKLKIVINCTARISAEEIYQYLTIKLARAKTLDKSLEKTEESVSITSFLVNTLVLKFFPELNPRTRKRSHSNNDSRGSLNKRDKKNPVTTEKNTEAITPSAKTTLTKDEKEKFLKCVEEATREFYAQEEHKVSSNQCQYKSYKISINISELFPNDQDKWELLVSDFKKIHLPRGKEKRGIILSPGNVTINGYSTFRLAEKWEITNENRKNYKKPTSIDFLDTNAPSVTPTEIPNLSSISEQRPIENNLGITDFFKHIPKNLTSFYEESPLILTQSESSSEKIKFEKV